MDIDREFSENSLSTESKLIQSIRNYQKYKFQ